jgi:hypothetical protein
MGSCIRFWGKCFGHKFRPRYTEHVTPPAIPDEFRGNTLTLAELIERAAKRETIYECDICARCGEVVRHDTQEK